MGGEQDDRLFRRHPGSLCVDLYYNNRLFRARTFDFSVVGIGAILDVKPGFGKGDTIYFAVSDAGMSGSGNVVWIKDEGSQFRIGIRSTGKIHGRLKDFRLADILIGLQRSSKTGVLTIEYGDICKNIYIKNGDMIFSSSNQPEDRLGDLLLREGKISLEQYNHSVAEMKKTGQKHAGVLVSLGYIKPAELVAEIRHHIEEIIQGIFSTPDGKFVFEERLLPPEEVVNLKLSAANLIYNGIRCIKNIDLFNDVMPSADSVPYFSPAPIDLFQDIKLDQAGRKILTCINNRSTVRDIVCTTGLAETEVRKLLFALTNLRMLDIHTEERHFNDIQEEVVDAIVEGIEEPALSANDPLGIERIEDMHRRYKDIGYYGVLGVSKQAAPSEIKMAYYENSNKYHPDRHFISDDSSLKNKLADIFSYIEEAYLVLSNPQRRAVYNKSLTATTVKPDGNRDSARAAFEEGKEHFQDNRPDAAELSFAQAASLDAAVAAYHYYYGLTLSRNNKLKKAGKSFEKALKLDPANSGALAEYGFVLFALGLPAKAFEMFTKALQLDPNNLRADEGMKKISS